MPSVTKSATTWSSIPDVVNGYILPWLGPGTIGISDDLRIACNFANTTELSQFIYCGGFNFALDLNPAWRIDKFVPIIERKQTNLTGPTGVISDEDVRLVRNGMRGETNKAKTTSGWGTTEVEVEYDEAPDRWDDGDDLPLSASELIDPGFAIAIAADSNSPNTELGEIDHVQGRVEYTENVIINWTDFHVTGTTRGVQNVTGEMSLESGPEARGSYSTHFMRNDTAAGETGFFDVNGEDAEGKPVNLNDAVVNYHGYFTVPTGGFPSSGSIIIASFVDVSGVTKAQLRLNSSRQLEVYALDALGTSLELLGNTGDTLEPDRVYFWAATVDTNVANPILVTLIDLVVGVIQSLLPFLAANLGGNNAYLRVGKESDPDNVAGHVIFHEHALTSNAQLNPFSVTLIRPYTDGQDTDWNGTADLVNEVPPNDGTFINVEDDGVHSFKLGAYNYIDPIAAIKLIVDAKMAEGTGDFTLGIRGSTGTVTKKTAAALSGTVETRQILLDAEPGTGAMWDRGKINLIEAIVEGINMSSNMVVPRTLLSTLTIPEHDAPGPPNPPGSGGSASGGPGAPTSAVLGNAVAVGSEDRRR